MSILLGIYLLARVATGMFTMNLAMNGLLMLFGALTVILAVMMLALVLRPLRVHRLDDRREGLPDSEVMDVILVPDDVVAGERRLEAGERDQHGKFPKDSVNGLAERQLTKYAELRQSFSASPDSDEDNG